MADQMTLDLVGQYQIRPPTDPGSRYRIQDQHRALWNAFLVCRRCQEGVVVKMMGPSGRRRLNEPPEGCSNELISSGFKPVALHPKPEVTKAPAHVPEPVARNFEEAKDNQRRRNYTSAAVMFRKALDRGTSALAPAGKTNRFRSMSLYERINALTENRELTPAMCDWAHQIRLDGNEAVHDEDADEAVAGQLQAFTEMFLVYAFTLPERVRQDRARAGDKADG